MATTSASYTYSTQDTNGEPSTFEITLATDGPLGSAGTVLDAFCGNVELPILGDRQGVYSGGYIDLAAAGYTLHGSINWLLNAYPQGLTGFPPNAVQAAIWVMLGQDWTNTEGFDGYSPADAAQVYQLVGQALSHQSFVPAAGESMAILIDPLVDGQHSQPMLVEVKAAQLGDRVWFDADADGLQDANEVGIANATVELLRDIDGDGQYNGAGEVSSTTTDADGNYSFKGLTPGADYQVRFVTPDGYDAASPRQSDASSGSGANSDGSLSDVVVLTPGEDNTTLDAGFYNYASLGDRVWNDANANGVQDAGESGKSNVTVELYTCVDGQPGALVGTQLTDDNGNYSFTQLKPGDYVVRFIASDGSVLSTADVGADQLDSDAQGAGQSSGFTGCYNLESGENDTSVDAGFYQPASLGDRVWVDSNANGVQDAGEAGKSGVRVELYTCVNGVAGALVDAQITDPDGNYRFSDLKPGDYVVRFIADDGAILSSANVGSDALDSDADSTGFTGCYTLAAGEYNPTVDAGFYENASLGDRVWNDSNANGVQDAGETGKANVTVELYTCVDGQPGALVGTQLTDTNGNYNFAELKPGEYVVKFITSDGSVLTTANVGNDATDSDANATTGLTGCYTLSSGEHNSTVDAGVKPAVPDTVLKGDQAVVCEDRSVSFNVLANDSGEGLKLIGVRHESASLDSLFTQRGGIVSFQSNGTVYYDTMADYYGNDKLVYTVEDSSGRQYSQTVDMSVRAVSDAPTMFVNAYNLPWHSSPTAVVRTFTLSDFFILDNKDSKQTFGTYNNGVANDIDTLKSVVVYAPSYGASLQYAGYTLTAGMGYEISASAIKAGYLKAVYNSNVTSSLYWRAKDSGLVDNDACYDGSVYSNYGTSTVVASPIALDLNGDHHIGVTGSTGSAQKDAGAELGHTVQFDMDADGRLDTIEWFDGSGDGILVDNRDGLAATQMDGSRLFGDQGGQFAHGYEQLAQLDANGDGQISGAELDGLVLWVDNGDAIVQDGELQSLASQGIVSMSTQVTGVVDDEGRGHVQSSATRADGSEVLSEDVYFTQEVPSTQELLSTDGAELDALVGAGAPDTSAAVPVVDVQSVVGAAQAAAADSIDVSQAAELLRQIALTTEVAVA